MQPYINWEIVESNNFGTYRYVIIKTERADGKHMFKGWVVYPSGKDYWLENDSMEGCRVDRTGMRSTGAGVHCQRRALGL